MSKVKKITVSNLKAVSKLTADFNGCTAIITGGNDKGKSSFLKSLPDKLRGYKPEIVLKYGEKEGFAEWELTTGEKFIWVFDGKKEKLTFITEKNIPMSVTKDLCKAYFPPVFDVDEFLNSSPAKQRKTLQQLTGIDFTEIDGAYKFAYDERTFANKRVVEEKARLVLIDPDLPPEPTDISELEKEFNGIEAHNIRFDNVVLGVHNSKSLMEENEKEIESLQQRIKILNDKNTSLDEDIIKGEAWCNDEKNKRKENGDQLAEQIRGLKETNKEIEANNLAIKQNEKYKVLVKDAEACDLEVKKIEKQKAEYIQNASMPDGFGFSEEGITYKGFEFTKQQLSSSGIYIAALKLAAMTLGEVRTLHFDASFLDKNSLGDIEKWANENDLQLLIERPDFEGGEIEYQLVKCE